MQRRLVHACLLAARSSPQHPRRIARPRVREKPEKTQPSKLEELGHNLMYRATSVRCKLCHLKCGLRDAAIQEAVQLGQCPGPMADFRSIPDADLPWKVKLPIKRFLDKEVHQSHHFGLKRGLLWCWTCGTYAAEQVRSLAKPCPGHAAPGASGQLRRLKAGLTPAAAVEWPLTEWVEIAGTGSAGSPPALGSEMHSQAGVPVQRQSDAQEGQAHSAVVAAAAEDDSD